ncbi:MAG: hypothetical protein C7M88_06025, partial [Candidatus Arcticimaribacter sp.]
ASVTSSERRNDVCIEMDSLGNEKGSRYVCEKQTLDLTKGSDILKRGSRYVCEKQTLDLTRASVTSSERRNDVCIEMDSI